jgi:hypothetical protein
MIESAPATTSRKSGEPLVVGRPRTPSRSLTAKGRPWSGPTAAPRASSASRAFASARRLPRSRSETTALMRGFSRSMRSRVAVIASTAERRLSRIACVSWSPVISAIEPGSAASDMAGGSPDGTGYERIGRRCRGLYHRRARLERPPMSDTLPDRLSTNPKSPFYDEALLTRGVGIRFNGKEKTNVEEYCVSEGWVRVAAGKTLDRKGNPLTITLKGTVEPYFHDTAAKAG